MLSYYWFDATMVVLLELICCVVPCLLLACDWFVDLILWFWCLWLCICVLVICVAWFVGCLFVFVVLVLFGWGVYGLVVLCLL